MKKGFTFIELLVVIAIIAILALVVFGHKTHACGIFSDCGPDTSNDYTFGKEAAVTEMNQRQLLNTTAIPTFQNSQERENLVKRLNTFNKPDKISYIYLISYGKVMAFYTVKGKVSSVDSMLTNTMQLVDKSGKQCTYGNSECYTVPSPDLDGSYGTNGNGIFFFTTEGAYVEWNGEYMLADQPLQLTTQPELVRSVK